MKQWIIQIILIILLIASIGLGLNQYIKNKSTIDRLTNNIEQLEVDNSTLKFTTTELKSYIKDNDTKHKAEVDSILRLLKIKPKNLIKYERIESQIKYDTILVDFKDTLLKVDSIYEKTFIIEKKCISVAGKVFSKDINTKLEIDNINVKNNIYIVESYKRKFWDYIFFRKGKVQKKIINDCGESNSNEINIIE